MIICNARTLDNPLTGVPRYLRELTSRFGDRVELVKPNQPRSGIPGHLWEQFVLPALAGKRLLWSPSISGPLAVSRQVITVHDVVPLDHPEWLSPRFSSWYRFLIPRLVRRVRSILVVSEFTRERLIYHCPDAEPKIKVVLLAADRRFAPADESSIHAMCATLALPSRHYLLALGSLEPRKNLPRLLQAWQRIQNKIPQDIWLVIAGAKGRDLVFGDTSIKELPPRVHLTGFVADSLIPALYSGAMASVYVSLYEGFGFPALEAMACGTPLLTSSVSSLPEVVGNAAVMVNPLEIEAIANGLLQLIEDSGLRSRLSSMGLARSRRFNWDQTANDTWRVLKEAAEKENQKFA